MSRRRGFLYAAIKASEAAARQHAVAERRQAAATTRAARERERDVRRQAAFDLLQHVLHGEQQVESLNADLAEQIEELSTLLSAGLVAAAPLDFATLKREPDTRRSSPASWGSPSRHRPLTITYHPRWQAFMRSCRGRSARTLRRQH